MGAEDGAISATRSAEEPGRVFRFRLYVAGDAPNSNAARENLRLVCERHLPGPYQVEIVDLLREPARALTEGVLVTPLLVLDAPGTGRRIVGSLSDTPRVLAALGLTAGGGDGAV